MQSITLIERIEELYERHGDTGFERILAEVPCNGDAPLADLIEADGRLRLRLHRPVELDRYLAAVPNLVDLPDALDAAIDMALRWLAQSGRADPDSIDALVAAHPDFAAAIRDAAALNNAVWSTTSVRRRAAGAAIELPSRFGPPLDDGGGRYELLELLGEGACGQVFLAVDRVLSEPEHPALVSVKVLRGRQSRRQRDQLVDEATKARRIDNPNVVRVLDRGTSDEGQDYVVYEFVDGGDLIRWTRRRHLSTRAAAAMAARIARGVHAAHMVGLVHCDLKPNNVVVTAEGEPKVADFGTAIRRDQATPDEGSDEDVASRLGNLAFMSPEQYRMEPGALTIPSDVYALGGILYWLLTERLPNGSTRAEIERTHDAARGRAGPPPLRPHCPDADRELAMICDRALAPRPADRFASAAEMAESLESWLRREPIAWTRPSAFRRLTMWVRRKPGLAITAGALVAIVAASGTGLWLFAAEAARQRFDAAVAAAGLEREQAVRDQFRTTLRRTTDRIKAALAKGFEHEAIPQIWIMDWIYGSVFVGDVGVSLETWNMRMDAIRGLIAESRQAGGEYALETMLWESALAFWLIEDGQVAQGERVLRETLTKWRTVLTAEDPWLMHQEALLGCAVVARTDRLPPGSDEQAALHEAVDAIERAEPSLNRDAFGCPLHYLMLHALQRAYAPALLDQPHLLAAVDEKIRVADD